MELIIKRLDAETINDQLELFNLVFRQTYSIDMWHHKHFTNPDSKKCDIFGAFDGDRLVGINGFISSRYKYSDVEYYVLQSCESAVHPDYRGKGIFSKIVKYALEQSDLKDDNCYIIGFPNTANAYPGFKKMGWDTLTWMDEFLYLSDFLSMKAQVIFPRLYMRQMRNYEFYEDDDISHYIEPCYDNKIRIVLNSSRLDWRTYHNSEGIFTICGLKDKRQNVDSYCLIKKENYGKIQRAVIIDWHFPNIIADHRKQHARLLLSNIRKKYGSTSVWVSINDPDYEIFKNIGLWEHKKARQPFIGKVVSDLGNNLSENDIWMPRMIDYDGSMF